MALLQNDHPPSKEAESPSKIVIVIVIDKKKKRGAQGHTPPPNLLVACREAKIPSVNILEHS